MSSSIEFDNDSRTGSNFVEIRNESLEPNIVDLVDELSKNIDLSLTKLLPLNQNEASNHSNPSETEVLTKVAPAISTQTSHPMVTRSQDGSRKVK